MKQETNLTTIGFSMLVIFLALSHIQHVQAESFSPDPGGRKHELAEVRPAGAAGGSAQFRGGQSGRRGRRRKGHRSDSDVWT